jgi:hypothetical protein
MDGEQNLVTFYIGGGFWYTIPVKKLLIVSGAVLSREVRLNPNSGMCHVIT